MDRKTKSIAITRYNYILMPEGEEEMLDEEGLNNHYTEYDPEGRPLKEISYNASGEFEEMYGYEYDSNGHLLHERYYPAEDEMAEEKTFSRDASGRITEARKRYQDGSVDTILYAYDADGNLLTLTTVNDEGETEQVEAFEWEGGELAGHLVTDVLGNPLEGPDLSTVKPSESRITHDEQGRVVLEEELNDNGEVVMAISRAYDDEGRQDTVDVYIDGQGQRITRHYFLKYEYTFFD